MSFYPLIINSTTCKVTIRVTSNEQAIISSNQRESRQILAIPPIQFWCNVKYMKARFREPVKHTCPDIDSIIDTLEKLRACNASLRDWGFDEAERVDELEDELSDKNSEIEKLEDTINDLEGNITKLEKEIEDLLSTQPSQE